MRARDVLAISAILVCTVRTGNGQGWSLPEETPGDRALLAYFRAETQRLAERCLADVHTVDDWTSRRPELRRQLAEMLSLDPWPETSDLKAVTTGRIEHPEMVVEKVRFQSRPGLYVTGNLYLPKDVSKPAPAVLYVCGHSRVERDGVSYGNKTHYQYHGAWLARNGYVCLTIDTLQLGEIEGLHHGTYSEGMWWWNGRGYTPAGVEAYNGIRALDYLQSRPEVDPERLGVTGRSGGGATSWWIAALDERVKVAVPVAGIADLENHVVDGCVEGHCDCMYIVNTYRWDYAQLAAMVAPRALLIGNTDKDSIFPLDGVTRIHKRVRHIYRLHQAEDKLGLLITEGPHEDTQDLQVPAFHWLNRHLKSEDPQVERTGESLFSPEQLKVLDSTPADEQNTRIQETFTALAPEADTSAWQSGAETLRAALRQKTFGGWPEQAPPLSTQTTATEDHNPIRVSIHEFTSQEPVRLRFRLLRRTDAQDIRSVSAIVCSPDGWTRAMSEVSGEGGGVLGETLGPSEAVLLICPRGVGDDAWSADEKKRIQIRRRFMLLGQTLAGMQVWDVCRALAAAREAPELAGASFVLVGDRDSAVLALFAAIMERPAACLLHELPPTHREGPDLLNVARILSMPGAVALAAASTDVVLTGTEKEPWAVAQALTKSAPGNGGEGGLTIDNGGGTQGFERRTLAEIVRQIRGITATGAE